MDIALYIKKIDHYINEIKNIDLIYVQKIITRLYSLKRKHSANPVFPPLKVLLSFA